MQLKIIEPHQRWQFSRAMMEMHHHRKQIFVDRLGWNLPNKGSWLEVDEFDNEDAVYIMAVSADGSSHLGSVRLLPTDRPHMLDTLFSGLCRGKAPSGERVWEISRLVASPEGADGRNILRVHRLLAMGIVEFGRHHGVERFTLVAESHRMPALLSIGWRVLPLSLPMEMGGCMVEAAEIIMEERTFEHLRRRSAGADDFASSAVSMRDAA
jgi:acyl-homoserine lactone synthase